MPGRVDGLTQRGRGGFERCPREPGLMSRRTASRGGPPPGSAGPPECQSSQDQRSPPRQRSCPARPPSPPARAPGRQRRSNRGGHTRRPRHGAHRRTSYVPAQQRERLPRCVRPRKLPRAASTHDPRRPPARAPSPASAAPRGPARPRQREGHLARAPSFPAPQAGAGPPAGRTACPPSRVASRGRRWTAATGPCPPRAPRKRAGASSTSPRLSSRATSRRAAPRRPGRTRRAPGTSGA